MICRYRDVLGLIMLRGILISPHSQEIIAGFLIEMNGIRDPLANG
jgi:hypothetical protein